MQLNANIGAADRVIRIVAGMALLSGLFLLAGNARWLGLLGVVPLVTAIVRFCPLYTILGIRTGSAAARGR